MILSDASVRNRVTIYFLTFVILLAGTYSYRNLPLESSPDVPIPNVFVTTVHRGVSPEDIEKNITIEIEKKLKGLEGVKKIKSQSLTGMSFINIEFITEMDIDEAVIKVKDKVDLAKPELPPDLEDEPVVEELNFSEMPILIFSLSGPGGMRQLTKIAEDLQEEIEAIAGVLEVEIIGDVEREIQIQVYPERIALYGIPLSVLEGAVRSENSNVSAGSIRTREGRYQLRVPGEFKSVREVESIVVATRNGQPVYLRDIAKVVDGLADRESHARMNGHDAVTLQVRKRTGENIVAIVDRIDETLARAQETFPPGTVITRISDRAKEIRNMVADLENNILTGLLLVVLVVMIAMGFRNAVLVSLSIPLSMLITFIVLQALGITLNMVVLFSLTLALGMLVDNAIVIIENIYRFMQQGVPRMEAAMRATGEVAWPIIGSSLTTIGAFFPLLFWGGIMGGFMVYLPKTVIITLASCLFVALVINPALAATIMRVKSDGPTRSADEIMRGGEHPMLEGGGRILSGYRWLLRHALRYRLASVALATVVLGGTILFWLLRVGLEKPQEFFPSIDPQFANVEMKMPEGADLQYADQLVREAACRVFHPDLGTTLGPGGERVRLPYAKCLSFRKAEKVSSGETYLSPSFLPDVEFVSEKSASGSSTGSFFGGGEDNQVSVHFVDLADRHVSSKTLVNRIEDLMKGIPGAEVSVTQNEEGPPTGAPINIEISGDDFAVLGRLARRVEEAVRTVPHVRNVRSDFEQGSPTIHLNVDRKRAALLGLSTGAIGSAIRSAINGVEVSSYREGDDDYDIMVRFLEKDRHLIGTLRRILIPTAEAGLVPLTTVAGIEYTGGVGAITRINHRRVVTVKADVDETMTTGITARQKAEALLTDLSLPAGYRAEFTGEMEFQKESEEFLSWAMFVALILILFILVAQFNSLSHPLIIMSAVLLSFGGVFLGLGVYAIPFGIIMTSVGVISLAGVVVNNAIVLVDYTQQLMDRGLSRRDAIVAAGATRLRPVLLTAITTVLGLIPMVTGVSLDFQPLHQGHAPRIQWVSESSQWWSSMAVAVIFGLGLATMLTLLIVPVLLSLVETIHLVARIAACRLVWLWWLPFDRVFRTSFAAPWAAGFAEKPPPSEAADAP